MRSKIPNNIEFDTPESWEEARQVGGLIGEIPSSFSTVIRLLKLEADRGASELSRSAQFGLGRLLKSDSFAAPLYYAAVTFLPEAAAQPEKLTRAELAKIFTPFELCTLIALIYLHRRIKKGCDDEEWKSIETALSVSSRLGGYVGKAIPSIGLAHGLIVGTIRPLAVAMFLGIDKNNFIKYRRELKRTDSTFDLDIEMHVWGCTHAQIAAVLLQLLGFGVEKSQSLAKGLVPELSSSDQFPREVLLTKITNLWIEALRTTSAQPNISHKVEFFPSSKDLTWLISMTKEVKSFEDAKPWISYTKESISPDETPWLFKNQTPSKPATTSAELSEEEALPEINPEDFEQLDSPEKE